MDTRSAAEAATTDRTTIERTSDQELVVTRTINGPRDVVFEAQLSGWASQVIGSRRPPSL